MSTTRISMVGRALTKPPTTLAQVESWLLKAANAICLEGTISPISFENRGCATDEMASFVLGCGGNVQMSVVDARTAAVMHFSAAMTRLFCSGNLLRALADFGPAHVEWSIFTDGDLLEAGHSTPAAPTP